MRDYRKTFVGANSKIEKIIFIIDQAPIKIALVVDEEEKLLGVVTDGDIRRGLHRGHSLDDVATKI